MIADHIVLPVESQSPYPYTLDGKHPSVGDALETFSILGVVASATERLRLVHLRAGVGFDPTLRVQKLPFRRPRWLSTSRLSQACLTPARDTRSRSIRSSRMRASRERWSSSMLGTLWPRRLVLCMAPSKVRMLRAQPGAASANISPGSEDV